MESQRRSCNVEDLYLVSLWVIVCIYTCLYLFCYHKVGDDCSISPELDRLIRQRGRDLRLRKLDQQKAVKIVNHLIDSLLEFLKNNDDQPFFREVSVLTSGSYYEMVKVKNLNDNFEKNQLVVSNRKSCSSLYQILSV